jgi:hypothetical protein
MRFYYFFSMVFLISFFLSIIYGLVCFVVFKWIVLPSYIIRSGIISVLIISLISCLFVEDEDD